VNVDGAVKVTVAAKPKAVLVFTVGKVIHDFINKVGENGIKPIYFGGSPVEPNDLIKATGANGEGVILGFGYPSYEGDLPIAKDFRQTMIAAGHKFLELRSLRQLSHYS
jgi:ABC-type branched-subunit amino acid transport system substrate-binding protein